MLDMQNGKSVFFFSLFQGDSGGPLVCPVADGSYAVYGVTSWGHRCGTPRRPGVYTSVNAYENWIIAQVMGEE